MKLNKKDWTNILILITILLIIMFSYLGITNLNASIVDYNSQHAVIPDYFRKLFLETKQIFPSFAFNIGAGENIYNLSYYGLFSPIIMFSYLFPKLSMINYIQIAMLIITITSVVLMYYFLRSKFNNKYTFLGTLLFLLSAPLVYHTHRHIMFINYMPFLLIGLIGIDKNKKTIITLSVFLMIMTSYYYSVCGIIALSIYYIYKYYEDNKIVKSKVFIRDLLKYIYLIIVGILLSGVLILPTMYVILNGRGDITNSVNIFKLLLPTINMDQIMYTSYTMGTSSILLIAVLYGLFNKKKSDRFLSIIFSLLIVFPVFIYILSGFMYIRGKVLIPLLPLAILLITNFLSSYKKEKDNKFYIFLIILTILCIIHLILANEALLMADIIVTVILYLLSNKHENRKILIYPVCFIALVICLFNNYTERYVSKDLNSKQYDKTYYDKVSELLNVDNNIYRVDYNMNDMYNINYVYDTNYYLPSVYSSLENKNYYNFVNLFNEQSNRILTALNPHNILFNTFMANKYLITDKTAPIGYEMISDNVYKNDNVLPIGYATNSVISENLYNGLSNIDKIYALMTNVVVKENIDNNYVSKINEEEFGYTLDYDNLELINNDDRYLITSNKEGKMVLKFDKPYENKILLISFDMNYTEACTVGDTSITINDIKNTLSCKKWTYPNNNYNFKYAISGNTIDKLDIEFAKGKYDISNVKIYSIDYNDIVNYVKSVSVFNIDKESTSGDIITGNINVKDDGYFILTIPYDKGFSIYLDGNKIDYEKVSLSYIGFKIGSGYHDIKIVYKAPYQKEGMIFSGIGCIMLLQVMILDIKKRKK